MSAQLVSADPFVTAANDHEAAVAAAIKGACRKIAPLWPLKHFVAVNPFLGFTGQSFASTCATLKRVAGTEMLMPRDFYREALAAGAIDDAALGQALAEMPGLAGVPGDIDGLKAASRRPVGQAKAPPAVVATVAEVLDKVSGGDRQASLVAFMIDEISRWCAGYFDEGQAIWRMPGRTLRPYAAWRLLAAHDLNAEAMGIAGFRTSVLDLPEDPVAAIREVVDRLGIPERAVEDYLHRALFDIGGWAAYARYIGWNAELDGREDDTLVQLLAIRIAYGWGLFNARRDDAFRQAWAAAMKAAAALPEDERLGDDPELALDLVLHHAYEIAFRRTLTARIREHNAAARPVQLPARRAVQAAFCIDVRSEVLRRAFETVCPKAETVGFAGFFGFPIEYVPIGHSRGGAQCPVLLKPSFIVCESVKGASEEEETEVLGLRLLRRRAAKAWKAFKVSAVSSFSYVETAGLLFAGKIVSDSAGLTRTVANPMVDGIDTSVTRRVRPRLRALTVGGRQTGFTPEQRVAMAEAVLKAMSMTGDFARLVLLAGHGSTTVNNPHASGLDCGACGGHTGEANARVAAAILNDPEVRQGLARAGIAVPADTWFLAAQHDTTTDEVTIFDRDDVPSSHLEDLAALEVWLQQASALARMERASLLGLDAAEGSVDEGILARSRDWSQVRPEWGLAGNAAFIAAPRERTQGLDLAGRSFLHSYDHAQDSGHKVLELIMTAPMVVASWINLQYFGSTVNNSAFGAGNKALHNVVGQLGVLEGNAGDLKVGLPWQSVHDGTRFVHEPHRLNVFIEAPEAAMDGVIARNPGVRDLVDNGWVHLHALADEGRTIRRYRGLGRWETC
ncbi:YbcC family protein [Alsobacter sp. R-9]